MFGLLLVPTVSEREDLTLMIQNELGNGALGMYNRCRYVSFSFFRPW